MKVDKYIIDKKRDIEKLDIKKRRLEIADTQRFITSIIGPRRAGKTFFLYDLIRNKLDLREEKYLFLNFEDESLVNASSKQIADSVNAHQEIYGVMPEYLFFDEIQRISGWENALFTLFEKKRYKIFISGSSSKLLSKEIATQLRGRSLSYIILPFSFKEFLDIKNVKIPKIKSTEDENKIKNMLHQYLKSGGFPDVVFEPHIAEKFFRNYLDVLIFRDIVEIYGIKNMFVIRFLINSLLSSYSKEFSINKTFNTLKSQGIKVSKKTLYTYSTFIQDTSFSFFLRKFDYSLKRSELSTPKVYLNDTGLVVSLLKLGFGENIGRIMENTVFLELQRRTNEHPLLEIYYWKDHQQREVDFVQKEGPGIKKLVQVCYNVEDPQTKERELKALVKASKELGCNNLWVITWNYENKEEYKNKEIRFIPLWKWLLNDHLTDMDESTR